MNPIDFLEGLITIPSLSGEEEAIAGYLVQRMAALGFQVHRDPVGNVVGAIGNPEAGRTILLLGHMDTVAGCIPVRREGGRLYGRGAVDAKGPLAAFVLAAARVAASLNRVRLLVVGAVEEEGRSRGAHHLVAAMEPPGLVVIGEPGGWQGITLGYKGVLAVNYRLSRPAGHSAGEGSNPAEEAVAFWNRLAAHTATINEDCSGRFEKIDPALRAIRTDTDGLVEKVQMDISLRIPSGFDVLAFQREMLAWRSGADIVFPYREPPFRAGKNNSLVRALLRAIRAEGGQPRFKPKTGTSDMNVVGPAWNCPIVAYGPGDSALDHTPEEHIAIEEFLRGVDVLARALRTLAREGLP